MIASRSAGVGASLVGVLLAWAGSAYGVTVSGCLAGKLGDVGRTAAQEIACWARDAAKPDAAARAACVARVEGRFSGGPDPSRGLFAKRERRPPCPTVGDEAEIAADVAAFVVVTTGEVGATTRPSRCDAGKLGCVGRYLTGAFACLARAAKGSGAVDPACVAKHRARLGDAAGGCLGKAVLRGDCSAGGDPGVLAAVADGFAAATLCALDPGGTQECGALPTPLPTPTRTATPAPTRTPTPTPTGGADASQLCVDLINQYRATIGMGPLQRWTDQEGCAEDQGFADSASGTPHSAFGQCTEWAQNECPNWPGPPAAMIDDCLALMWAEGPGEPYSAHGHYINMTNPSYTKVACGFAVLPNGRVWAVQDFR
ncbi:MAG: CAP domain-containing protein [Deltaproteobacteria bacterium]|nr:CAP domain-containing protein [Deltaproteobacteria bacterium]